MRRGLILGAVVLAGAGAAAWALLRTEPRPAATDETAAAIEDPAAPPPAADGVAGLAVVEGLDPAAIPGGTGASGKPWWETPAPPLTPAQQAALDALIARLADTDFHVRIRALRELGRWHRYAEKAIPILLEVLHDERREIREAAAWVLSSSGPATVPGLLRLIAGDDPAAAASAASAVRAWPGIAATAVPVLAEALGRADRDLGIALVRCLRLFGADARFAVPALIGALSHDSVGVRRETVVALGELGLELPTVLPAFLRILANPDDNEDVRATVAIVLGRLGPEAAVAIAALTRAAEGEAYGPRLAALEALAALGTTAVAAVPALLRLAPTDDARVRLLAVRALGAIEPARPEVIAALTLRLKDEDGVIAGEAACGLVWGGKPGWDALVAGYSDPEAAFGAMRASVHDSRPRSPREALDLCCALIDDGRPPLDRVGRNGVRSLWRQDEALVPIMVRRLETARTREDREFWIEKLAGLGGGFPRASQALVSALSDPQMAAFALRLAQGLDVKTLETARPRIEELARTGDDETRSIAKEVLLRLAAAKKPKPTEPAPSVPPTLTVPPPAPTVPPPPPPPKSRDR